MGLYQPRIRDPLIRKLYFWAKREGKPMTRLVNEVIEQALISEPEPPPYEKRPPRQAALYQKEPSRS